MSKTKRLIDVGWRRYAEHILPTGASGSQKQETRRAFYAGAAHLFEALTDAVGPDDVSEDAGMDIMAATDAELRAFFDDVKRGRA